MALTEKQRKLFVEALKDPKNDKTTLGELLKESNFGRDRVEHGYKMQAVNFSDDELLKELEYSGWSEEELDKLSKIFPEDDPMEVKQEWSWEDSPSINVHNSEEPWGAAEICNEQECRNCLLKEGFSEQSINSLFGTITAYYEGDLEHWEWTEVYLDNKHDRQRQQRLKLKQQGSLNEGFDYREYLAKGWLQKEAKEN